MYVSCPASSWRRSASASPRFECPTIPNTWRTPQLTIVSAITSVTVRTCVALRLDADVDAVVADLDRERRHAVTERRAAVQRAVVVPVPRAAQHPLLDRPLAERAALVRAAVAERARSAPRSASRQSCAGRPTRSSRALPEVRPRRARDARSASRVDSVVIIGAVMQRPKRYSERGRAVLTKPGDARLLTMGQTAPRSAVILGAGIVLAPAADPRRSRCDASVGLVQRDGAPGAGDRHMPGSSDIA